MSEWSECESMRGAISLFLHTSYWSCASLITGISVPCAFAFNKPHVIRFIHWQIIIALSTNVLMRKAW